MAGATLMVSVSPTAYDQLVASKPGESTKEAYQKAQQLIQS